MCSGPKGPGLPGIPSEWEGQTLLGHPGARTPREWGWGGREACPRGGAQDQQFPTSLLDTSAEAAGMHDGSFLKMTGVPCGSVCSPSAWRNAVPGQPQAGGGFEEVLVDAGQSLNRQRGRGEAHSEAGLLGGHCRAQGPLAACPLADTLLVG